MTVTADRESRVVIPNVGFVNPIPLKQYVKSSLHLIVYADEAELTEGVDYHVDGLLSSVGVEVTILGPALAINPTVWVVEHRPPVEQGSDLSLGGRFGLAFEQALDDVVRTMQSFQDRLDRGVRLSVTSAPGVDAGQLPPPVANNLVGWNATATGMENKGTVPQLQTVANYIVEVVNVSANMSSILAVEANAADISTVAANIQAVQDTSVAVTAVLFAPQTLSNAQQAQAQKNIGHPIIFDTVQDLLADTLMSYTADPGKIHVGQGDVIAADWFRFEVAGPYDVDAHETTAGGIKLYEAGPAFTHIDRLARISGSNWISLAFLTQEGRFGEFKWNPNDLSDEVSIDTESGVYIAPASDPTGSSGAWVRQHDGEYFAKWFGAKEDGTTNDRNAIQAAINLCLSGLRPVPLVLTAMCKVDSALIINNRVVGTSAGADTFFIRGRGELAGFTSLISGNIIDTTLDWVAPFNAPPACNITFENITWLGVSTNGTYCVSSKFLKVRFFLNRFNAIRAVSAPNYLQSWYFDLCSMIGTPGNFVSVAGRLYDFRINRCDFETCTTGVKSFNAGVYGGSLTNNLFQNGVSFFIQGEGEGLSISGNYIEGNSGPDIVLSDPINVGSHRGTQLTGNFFGIKDAGQYAVVIGQPVGMICGGNAANNANLYDTTYATPGSFRTTGDYVTPSFTKFSNPKHFDGEGAGLAKEASLTTGVSLTTGTALTLVSLSLEAGEWDVSGNVVFDPGATTSVTSYTTSISMANNTHGDTLRRNSDAFASYVSGGFDVTRPTPVVRLTLSSTTTVYLVASSNFSASTMTAIGRIMARRAGGQ